MTIFQIYSQYSIPINLQEHMLRVAAVGKIICDNIKDIKINKNLIIKTLLLHDMGNILKFDFSKTNLLDPRDKKKVEQLRKTQQLFLEKYGSDTDEATLKIMKELGIDEKIIGLCATSHGKHLNDFANKDNWEQEIVYYCDMRVGPLGILSVSKRFTDLIKRNPNAKSFLDTYCQQCLELEKNLQNVVTIDLQKIDDEMVAKVIPRLKNFLITTAKPYHK